MYRFASQLTGNLPGNPEEIEQKLIDALKTEGFGILSEIGVQATLKAKPGVAKRPYKILSVYNSTLANQAIDAKPDIGFLLPCNVELCEEENGAIRVSFIVPKVILNLVRRDDISDLANKSRSRLFRVCQLMGGTMIDR